MPSTQARPAARRCGAVDVLADVRENQEPMPSPVRHVRASDGTRLAWTSLGSGGPPVLLTDGIGCAGYIWQRLAPAIARERRVLHWNYRGHGMSDRPRDPSHATIDDCVGDLLAVLDAAGEERAVLAGHSMGVQVVIEAHRRAPDRVAALMLICGAPGRLIDTFHDSPVLKLVFPWARAAFERWPRLAASGFRAIVTSEVAMEYALAFEVNRALVHREDLRRYFHDLAQVDSALFVRLLESAAAHDVSDHLPSIREPTLVVAGERDGFTPMRLSVTMHEAIAGSELLVLPEGTHVGPLEHPDLVADRVQAFLSSHVPVRRRRPRAARPTAARTAAPRRKRAPRPPR
jgi:pimeloyl-ACP methyl ester carboxylesterase